MSKRFFPGDMINYQRHLFQAPVYEYQLCVRRTVYEEACGITYAGDADEAEEFIWDEDLEWDTYDSDYYEVDTTECLDGPEDKRQAELREYLESLDESH